MGIFSVKKASRFAVELYSKSLTAGLYDWTEKLSLWSIARIFIEAKEESRKQGFVDELRLKSDMQRMFFVVRYHMKLTPTFYKIIQQQNTSNLQMLVEFENYGKSSITIAKTLKDSTTNDILGMTSEIHALVDRTTRRSAIIPTWFKDLYGSMRKPKPNTFLQRNVSCTVPQNTFNVKVITRYRDLDGHVSVAAYLEYFIECLSAASRDGYFRHLPNPLSNYFPEEIDVSYRAECGPREEINVSVWQDEENNQLISFAVYLKEKCLANGNALFGKDLLRNESKQEAEASKL